MARNLQCLTIFSWVLCFAAFLYTRPSFHGIEEKYLGLPTQKGRLGNQLFSMFSGYAISLRAGRKFYIRYEAPDRTFVDANLARLEFMFPKLSSIYSVRYAPNDIMVPLNYVDGQATCCAYEDPIVLRKYDEPYIYIDNAYVQHASYLKGYEKDVRKLMTFRGEIVDEGQKHLAQNKMSYEKSVCVHIRRADFMRYGAGTEMNSTIAVLKYVLKTSTQKQLIIFGDDAEFMTQIGRELKKQRKVTKWMKSDGLPEHIDLYLASAACSSFIITAPASTFGFWLGFAAGDTGKVYVLEDDRVLLRKNLTRDMFPHDWTMLRSLNGGVDVI